MQCPPAGPSYHYKGDEHNVVAPIPAAGHRHAVGIRCQPGQQVDDLHKPQLPPSRMCLSAAAGLNASCFGSQPSTSCWQPYAMANSGMKADGN